MAEIRLALDKNSARTYDIEGRLRVAVSNISKANVCPYIGHEIPDPDGTLNLDPKKVYQLLRDPGELEKAAPTSNGVQLMIKHIAVSPEDPKKMDVVGSIGTDAVFKKPYLQNSLIVWDAVAIAGIESEDQVELSCGYRYRADMTPGTYEGVAYDGVMRDISFNHVALVTEGRAGSDVVVGDSQLETSMSRNFTLSRKAAMAKGALVVFLKPKLANDAKIDLNPILDGVTHANWEKKKVQIAEAIKIATKGKLAQDASLKDLMGLLDMFSASDNDGTDESPDADKDGATDPKGTEEGAEDEDDDEEASDENPDADLDGAKAEKVTADAENDKAEILTKLKALLAQLEGGAADEPPEFPGKPKKPTSEKEKPMGASDKTAMDAAIAAAVKNSEQNTTKRLNDIAEAREAVRPHVGELRVAFDSAEAVYKMALDAAGVDLTDVPPAAYKAMVKMLVKEQTTQTTKTHLAHDSAAVASFASRFPTAGPVIQLG
jgi:hypothetical protein